MPCYEITHDEKIKTIDKAQYNLDNRTAKVSALSSVNVGKYEFLTDANVLPEKAS